MNLIETYNGSGFYAQYATSADYASNGTPLSAALTAVPDTYLQNTDLTISNNKVTEISGIPLAGGGTVPEGIMVESGLEYDSTEISGYSGSAFKDVALTDVVTANSGAWGGSALPVSAGKGVKISLQNDTLVFSNDETVLFETTATNGAGSLTLSESLKNFERVAVLPTRGWPGPATTTNNVGGTGPYMIYETYALSAGNKDYESICPVIFEGPNWKMSKYSANDAFTQLEWSWGFQRDMTGSNVVMANSYTACVGIRKVIGINRIAGE